uniref:Protein cornichon n=1 Tax=Panagrolaimus sp. JU765 TaxID=591449 RepID=A0AC34Q3U4_9BILA
MFGPSSLKLAKLYSSTSIPGTGFHMAFTFAAFCYLIALIAVICIDELKTDYKNPIDQCRSLNQLVLPEYGLHFAYTVLFVLSTQLFAICWNVPLAAYHIHRYLNRPVMTGPGIYDPTSIMNQNELSRAHREGWIKLGFYLISFFYYLYAMIYTMVTS